MLPCGGVEHDVAGDRIEGVFVDLIDYSQGSCDDHFMDGTPVDDTVRMLDEGLIDPFNHPFDLLEVAGGSSEPLVPVEVLRYRRLDLH